MAQHISSDSSKFTLFRCQGVFFPQGSLRGVNMLSMSEVSFKNTVDYLEGDAYDDAVTYEAVNIPQKVACEMSITMDQVNQLSMAAQHFTDNIWQANSQSLNAEGTCTIDQADVVFDPAGGVSCYQLVDANGNPVQNVTTVVLTYGMTVTPTAITLTQGLHYTVDLQTGVFTLLLQPSTFATATNLVATWAQPAVLATAGLLDIGGLSGTGLLGRIALLGVNTGMQWRCDIPQVRLGPDGDASLQNTEKFSQQKLVGKVFATNNDPTTGLPILRRNRYYRLQQLQPAA